MEDREPNKQEEIEIAEAAYDAAKRKAVELGFDAAYGLAGLALAGDVAKRTIGIYLILGPELADLLVESLEMREIEKMFKEAESTLE